MGFLIPPEDRLICAIASKQPQVRLEHCIGSIEGIFKKALKKERRLLAFLSSYNVIFYKRGVLPINYDCDVTISYQEPCPASLDDVVVDNGSWDAASLLKKGLPQEISLITTDTKGVAQKLDDILDVMLTSYEGLQGWQMNSLFLEKLSQDAICAISYCYIVPLQQLRQFQAKGGFAAKTVWKSILGKAQVPQFVKPFLALSYLTQECHYDQRAFDEVENNPTVLPSDPIPHLAYGPLVERTGICSGLAWAFKTLMDEARIECICIGGYLKEDQKTLHMWNLVKIDGQFYHVDPTWGIKDDGVFVGRLMQPDSMMRDTHLWETRKYPPAKGVRFDYSYIEDYLAENGNELLDNGANEMYFFPEKIVE